MGSLSGLEIGLTFVLGFIILGLVAEVYYFLWWRRRLNNTEITDESNSYVPLFSYFFFWKKPNSIVNNPNRAQEFNSTISRNRVRENNEQDEEDLEMVGTSSSDALLKGLSEENLDVELMRIHNLCGPPRFLFTIKEETKEDLEDAKSRGDRSRKGSRTRSLSDVVYSSDTPFLTPMASPTIKTSYLDGYHHRGFNPLFESFTETDLRSSPPPKFKFLRDAEDKLIKRIVEESERRKALKDGVYVQETKGSLNSPMNKNMEIEIEIQQQEGTIIQTSGPSKVIPLASSPLTVRPINL